MYSQHSKPLFNKLTQIGILASLGYGGSDEAFRS